MSELEALATLAKNANARIYIGFDKHLAAEAVIRPRPQISRDDLLLSLGGTMDLDWS